MPNSKPEQPQDHTTSNIAHHESLSAQEYGIRLETADTFVTSCLHPYISQSKEILTEYICNSFHDIHNEEGAKDLENWRFTLEALKSDMSEFSNEEISLLQGNDDVFKKIFELIIQTKEEAMRNKETLSSLRRALFHLFNFRLGFARMPKYLNEADQKLEADLDNKWLNLLEKLEHEDASL